MIFSFKETSSTNPLKLFELCLGASLKADLNVGIYYPTKDLHEFMIEKNKTKYGIDMECEAVSQITNQVCELFSALAADKGRTRLEMHLAIMEIQPRLREFYTGFKAQQELNFDKPTDLLLNL